MFGNKDRDILIELYAKVCAMQSEIDQLKTVKLSESEENISPFLNEDGLYSIKDYKERAKANAIKNRGELK